MRISDWSSDVCSSDLSSGGSSPRHRLCEQHAFHPSSFSASVLTKVKWNCVPPPCAGSIQMRPPLASTIVRQIERPPPLPPAPAPPPPSTPPPPPSAATPPPLSPTPTLTPTRTPPLCPPLTHPPPLSPPP